jgi:hypothetical protein
MDPRESQKDEFIEKLKTDDEFNKKWGNPSNKIVE